VDISHKGQQVVVFAAEDGFVAILKKMTTPIVAVICKTAHTSEQPPHDLEMSVVAALEKEMGMVSSSEPRADPAFAFDDDLAESLQEPRPILSSSKIGDLLIPRTICGAEHPECPVWLAVACRKLIKTICPVK